MVWRLILCLNRCFERCALRELSRTGAAAAAGCVGWPGHGQGKMKTCGNRSPFQSHKQPFGVFFRCFFSHFRGPCQQPSESLGLRSTCEQLHRQGHSPPRCVENQCTERALVVVKLLQVRDSALESYMCSVSARSSDGQAQPCRLQPAHVRTTGGEACSSHELCLTRDAFSLCLAGVSWLVWPALAWKGNVRRHSLQGQAAVPRQPRRHQRRFALHADATVVRRTAVH